MQNNSEFWQYFSGRVETRSEVKALYSSIQHEKTFSMSFLRTVDDKETVGLKFLNLKRSMFIPNNQNILKIFFHGVPKKLSIYAIM